MSTFWKCLQSLLELNDRAVGQEDKECAGATINVARRYIHGY